MGEALPSSRHPEGLQMYFLNIKAAMTATQAQTETTTLGPA